MDKFFSIVRGLGLKRGPQRMLGGVLGGIAAKLNVDVAYVRIAFLLFALLPGPAFVFYLVAWAILPDQRNVIPLQSFLDRRSLNRPCGTATQGPAASAPERGTVAGPCNQFVSYRTHRTRLYVSSAWRSACKPFPRI